MASQKDKERPLIAVEQDELDKYNAIISFHDLVASGKHPKLKLERQQLARNNGPPALIGTVGSVVCESSASSVAQTPLSVAQPNEALSNAQQPHPMAPATLAPPEVTVNTCRGKTFSHRASPASLDLAVQPAQYSQVSLPSEKRYCLSRKAVAEILQPSQSPNPPPPDDKSTIPFCSKADTSRINYTCDYYQDLGVHCDATKVEVCNVFRALKPATPIQREAYEILSNDRLRYIYDDARAFSFNWAVSQDKAMAKKKGPGEEKELKMDLSINYYNLLGVQAEPSTTAKSVMKAFRRKSIYDPSRPGFHPSQGPDSEEKDQRKWDLIQEAYAVLSNRGLREQYDSCRGILSSVRLKRSRTDHAYRSRRTK